MAPVMVWEEHETELDGIALRPTMSMLDEEENYPEPGSLQEELNEIIDAFYECVPEDDIRAFQRSIEDIQGERIAEQALLEPAMAPVFELEDQDGDMVSLPDLLRKGPVVLTFYRGKWCPHCNATLMRYQKQLVPALKQYNASLVAISPMMPDGTAFLATKRDLEFRVCSDLDNAIAKAFKITFTVQPHSRPFMTKWGDDLPEHNGVDSWDIPLPATYVIAPNGQIAWSFVDNNPGIRAEVPDIVQQVRAVCTSKKLEPTKPPHKRHNRNLSTTFRFGTRRSQLRLWGFRSTSSCSTTDAEEESVDQGSVGEGRLESSAQSEDGDDRKKRNKLGLALRVQDASEFLKKYKCC